MDKTIVTLSSTSDAYNFRAGDPTTYVLDNDTWRLARWADRLRWAVRRRLRLGTYSRVVAVDHAEGRVTLELIRWSWLRFRWVRL